MSSDNQKTVKIRVPKKISTDQQERLAARNQKIVDRYNELSDVKVGGKHLYRHIAILQILGQEFFLAPDYVGKIITR